MYKKVLCLLVLGLSIAGCSSSDQQSATLPGGDLEWPPAATVYFDNNRVFNADCATDEDCAMALGYYHAFDRFVQMDFRRRFATGRLVDWLDPGVARVFGVVGIAADARALFSTRGGQPLEEFLYQQASPKTKGLLDAYAAGVNQWIDDVRTGENGAVFPREFEIGLFNYGPDSIPAWAPQDCVATILALIDNLTNDESSQVNAAVAREAMDDDTRFSDLWSRRPLEESSILPLDWMPPSLSAEAAEKSAVPPMLARPALRHRLRPATVLNRLRERLQRLDEFRTVMFGAGRTGDDKGSNSWVVGPSLTTDGNALLSNDPHLGMTQPATWYLAHLDAKTNGRGVIHTAGITFAGLPWVILGQNESIAWGATTTVMDLSDVYVETLFKDGGGNPTGVLFRGEEVPFTRTTFTVDFSDGSTEDTELLFVPHHGAVRELDVENDMAVTLRWAGNDVDTDINFLTQLAQSTTMAEAKVALSNITTVGQNWCVIDPDNNIGWFPYNRLPKRTWATNLSGDAPPWLPLDGTGDFEWDEFFALEELPQAENPTSGYIATANNAMTGALFDGDPTTLPGGTPWPPYQVESAAGFRHARIVELIEGIGDQHTRATMDQIVSDIHSLIGERMRPGILAIADDPQTTPGINGAKVIAALEDWDLTCPTGLAGTDSESSPLSTDADELVASSGCTAFHALLIELRARIEANENAPGGRSPSFATYYSIVDPAELAAGDVYWDDPGTAEVEDKFQVMSDALQAAGDFLDTTLGPDETQWAWGRLHGLLLSSDLSLFQVFEFDNPAPGDPLFANDGGLFTVDVANPGEDFVQTAGPSMRFVCEASPTGPACTIQLPGGQSSDINSPHYEDLLPGWLANEPRPLVFDIAEAAANAAETITF